MPDLKAQMEDLLNTIGEKRIVCGRCGSPNFVYVADGEFECGHCKGINRIVLKLVGEVN